MRRSRLALPAVGLPAPSSPCEDPAQQATASYALASGLRLSPPPRLSPGAELLDDFARIRQEQVSVHRRTFPLPGSSNPFPVPPPLRP